MALCLTAKQHEWICIGKDVRLKVPDEDPRGRSNSIRLIIEAPEDIKIHRQKVENEANHE
jgi:sRNA-binding carbon storage regulator CsrA